MNKGKIISIIGPVVDIEFNEKLPEIYNAVEVKTKDKKLILEVAYHLGSNVVRAVAMGATEGLTRGVEAVDTGKLH